MTGGHGHGNRAVTAGGRYRTRMLAVLALTLAVAAVQIVGGLLSGSLALLADAGHMLTDASGVTIAILASVLAARPATTGRTYGWQRAEVLGALLNALLLIGIAVWVLFSAVRRWSDPPEVATTLMLAVAVAGALANLTGLLLLRAGAKESVNVRGAYLEVLGDLLGSAAVIVAGVVIAVTGWLQADVLASVAIGVMILPRAWSLLRDVVDVLLEATPPGVDLDAVRTQMRTVPGVLDVHDLHAWTITSGMPVLSAHVIVDDECIALGRSGEVLDDLAARLADDWDVEHCTFQLEPMGHSDHEPAHHP